MFDLKIIERFYSSFPKKVDKARDALARPLTYTEKDFIWSRGFRVFNKHCKERFILQ